MAWLHQAMGRPDAEEALMALGGTDGQFVVRGHKNPTKKVLSVMFRGKATHHLMQETDEGVLVNNKSVNGAQTVQEAIETLQTEKVKGWPVKLTDFPPQKVAAAAADSPAPETQVVEEPTEAPSVAAEAEVEAPPAFEPEPEQVPPPVQPYAEEESPPEPEPEPELEQVPPAVQPYVEEESPYAVVDDGDDGDQPTPPPRPSRGPSESSAVDDGNADTASINAFADALGSEGFVLGEPAWLHSGLDRNGAIKLLTAAGLHDGLFLVRRRTDPATFAIDLAFRGTTAHHLAHADPADRSQLAMHGAASMGLFPTLNELIAFLAQPCDRWPCRLTEFVPNASVDATGSPVQLGSYSAVVNIGHDHYNPGGAPPPFDAVTEAESTAAEGVITDITKLGRGPVAAVDGEWKCGECGIINQSDPRDTRQRQCGQCGVVRALRRARDDELPANESAQSKAGIKKKISAEAEADRAALQDAVRVISAVRQDKLYEAIARYVNRKWSLTDLVLGLGEILRGVAVDDRAVIEELLGKLIPVSQRAAYTMLIARAQREEQIDEFINETDLEELATLTRLVSGTLARIRGDTRTDDQITSFERRVQLASTQRAWAVTKLQAAAADAPFNVELVAKAVHVGWARSVVSTWAPEYGIEPLGNLVMNDQGLMDTFNFSTAQGHNIYKQRVVLASQRYTLAAETAPREIAVVPEVSKHFYRVAAEVLVDACQRLDSDALSKKVVREDKFAFVELKQLGLLSSTLSRPQSNSSTPFSTPGSRRGASLTGRGGDHHGFTPRFALPPDGGQEGPIPPAYENGEAAPPWFHDVMDKDSVSALLAAEDDGTFLVRQRPGKADFGLGLKFQGVVTHHLVAAGPSGVLQINGKEVVTDAHSLELLVAGLYQPQANWPARLQSFIPRGGVSSATVARTQSALSAGGDSARSPKVASDPRAQQGNGASRGHDNSSATGGQIIAVSIEKGAGPIGMTFAGPRNAQDPRVGVFITKVKEGTPAAASGKIIPGLRVLSVNGADTTTTSKSECATHFKVDAGEMIDLVLKQDFEAYATFQSTDPDGDRPAEHRNEQHDTVTPIGLPKSVEVKEDDAEGPSQFTDATPNVEATATVVEEAVAIAAVVPEGGLEADGAESDGEPDDGVEPAGDAPSAGDYEDTDSAKITKVTIAKGAGPLGLKFVGPKGPADPRVGVFVTVVKEGSSAAAAIGGPILPGMRILSVNGKSTIKLPKTECGALFNVEPGDTIDLVLAQDDEAYNLFNATGAPSKKTTVVDDQPESVAVVAEPEPESEVQTEPEVATPAAPTSPSLQKNRITESDMGSRVAVEGYDVLGTLKFVGPHHVSGSDRCGVELDQPVGKNNGTVKGHHYFDCAPKCGIICAPKKVTLLDLAAVVVAPPLALEEEESPSNNLSVTLVKGSTGLGMSIAYRAGFGNFISVLKPGGVAEAAFADAGNDHTAEDGLKILRLNGTDVAERPKADVTAILRGLVLGDTITVEYELESGGVKAVVAPSPAPQPKAAPEPKATVSAATAPPPEGDLGSYDDMKRMQLIKLLRARNVDYGDAKNTDDLKDLARASHPDSAPPMEETVSVAPAAVTAAPPPQAQPDSAAEGAPDEYDGMKRLKLIKLLRTRNVDYSGAKNVEELKVLARKTGGSRGGRGAASSEPPKWISKMSREESAQAVVTAGVGGGFVVRPSERSSSGYTITTLQNGKPQNFGIDKGTDAMFNFSKSDLKFDSLGSLIQGYTTTTHNYFSQPLAVLPQFQ